MKDINMKKLLTALTLTALTSTVVNAAGYGVVDLERVVENSSYLKQQNSSFQQKIQPQSTKLDQLSKELQDLQQRLQTGDKLSAADKEKNGDSVSNQNERVQYFAANHAKQCAKLYSAST